VNGDKRRKAFLCFDLIAAGEGVENLNKGSWLLEAATIRSVEPKRGEKTFPYSCLSTHVLKSRKVAPDSLCFLFLFFHLTDLT
jgi:hypothetical protein